MRQPCDGIGLPRPGGVLYQVIVSGPLRLRMAHRPPHAVELVIPRKDHRLLGDLPDALVREDALLFDLQVHEAPEDVEQTVPLPYLAPQIGRAITAIGGGRIPRVT